MTTPLKKRFIAGAICPQCQLPDKIALFKTGTDEYAECVRCKFHMPAPKALTPPTPGSVFLRTPKNN